MSHNQLINPPGVTSEYKVRMSRLEEGCDDASLNGGVDVHLESHRSHSLHEQAKDGWICVLIGKPLITFSLRCTSRI